MLVLFLLQERGRHPQGGVNILADCSILYEEVNGYKPSFPPPSATEEVSDVNLEPCPAYISATEVVGSVNLGHEYEDTEI